MARKKRASKKDTKKETEQEPVVEERDVTAGDTAPGGDEDLATKVDETSVVETAVEEPGVAEFDVMDEYEEVGQTIIPTRSTTAAARRAQLAPTTVRRVARQSADVRFKNRRERIKARRARQGRTGGPRY